MAYRMLLWVFVFASPAVLAGPAPLHQAPNDACPRPSAGSVVPDPRDLRSRHGVLQLDLTVRNYRDRDGASRYCYLLPDGTQSPTLRLNPGELLILRLKNELSDAGSSMPMPMTKESPDPCQSGAMTATSSNLHFHGLTVPPRGHQDDVLKTSIQPGDVPFEYRFRIPANEPPGLYWYHP